MKTNCCIECRGTKWPTEFCRHSCHSKAPETIDEMKSRGRVETKIGMEAPTDESWEDAFYKEFVEQYPGQKDPPPNIIVGHEAVKSFIASLLQKERQQAYGIGTEVGSRLKENEKVVIGNASWREGMDEGRAAGFKEGTKDIMAIYEAGKSEAYKELERKNEEDNLRSFENGERQAFRLVRKMIEGMKHPLKGDTMPLNHWCNQECPNSPLLYNQALTDLLSTFEGK